MTAPNVLDALRDALGDAVSTTDADLAAARTDKSGHVSDAAPIAVVSARSTEDVQTVMRIATATGTPVVTRGAGTGLAGGALGGAGEIVLSTLGMTRIHEINEPDLLAVVDPGVINGAFNDLLLTVGSGSPLTLRAGRSRPWAATSPPAPAASCARSTG
jgi:glycolate oxidase